MFGFLKLPGVSAVVSKVANLIPNPNARKREKAEQMKQVLASTTDVKLAQLKINAIEAQSKGILASNWRPFLCVGLAYALLYMTVFKGHLEWLILAMAWNLPPLPVIDMEIVKTYLVPLLGFGIGARTVEKILKVAKN